MTIKKPELNDKELAARILTRLLADSRGACTICKLENLSDISSLNVALRILEKNGYIRSKGDYIELINASTMKPHVEAVIALNEGRKAAYAGVAVSSCPYDVSAIRQAWRSGWFEIVNRLQEDRLSESSIAIK